jgi:hypothetical protein
LAAEVYYSLTNLGSSPYRLPADTLVSMAMASFAPDTQELVSLHFCRDDSLIIGWKRRATITATTGGLLAGLCVDNIVQPNDSISFITGTMAVDTMLLCNRYVFARQVAFAVYLQPISENSLIDDLEIILPGAVLHTRPPGVEHGSAALPDGVSHLGTDLLAVSLQVPSRVSLEYYDLSGRKISPACVMLQLAAGRHIIGPHRLSAGIYVLRASADGVPLCLCPVRVLSQR